jgi:hypothetical protein
MKSITWACDIGDSPLGDQLFDAGDPDLMREMVDEAASPYAIWRMTCLCHEARWRFRQCLFGVA